MLAFFRTRAGTAAIAIGLVGALAAFLLLDFPQDTGTGRKLFFSTLLGALAAYGAWCAASIPAFLANMIGVVRGTGTAKPALRVHHQGPLPVLSPRKQGEVRRMVRAMAEHGVFAPEVPDPALLFAGLAEVQGSLEPDSILDALEEVAYYHPDVDSQRWMANLVMHDSHAEQDPAAQIADLARLAGDALDVRDMVVRQSAIGGSPRIMRVDVAMNIDGAPISLSYAGDAKYLSTHIHHAMAERVRKRGSGKRLAWLWTAEQGVWISLLDDDAVERLNAALKLGPRARCEWSWVEETPPFASGDKADVSTGP
jgi:hypothetical protein